jgi:hypothetical protein
MSDPRAPRQYQGILFPERAENLSNFSGYKVFLEHWDGLGAELRRLYEGLALRRDSKALAVFGDQGAGKTLFANKLADDIERTRKALDKGQLAVDPANLWHRICGTSTLDRELISSATARVSVHMIENKKTWVTDSAAWLGPQKDRHGILIADNAERAYFRQGLLELTDAEYLEKGESDAALKLVAQNFVAKCRTDLRGALIVMLSNDDSFLLRFLEAVDRQHDGLVTLASLPLPKGGDKETVIRVNTNRLNRISYWFCLDKAGPADKQKVRTSLLGASTYPAAFTAVDDAIRAASPSRVGRPAKKNMLSLIVLAGNTSGLQDILSPLGTPSRTEFIGTWAIGQVYSTGWADATLDNQRECELLESEWDLRVVILGPPFIGALLSNDQRRERCSELLGRLERVLGPGTRSETREDLRGDIESLLRAWPSVEDVSLATFWAKGQARSGDYEAALASILAGYNTQAEGFLEYRPDHIITPFRSCAVTSAISDDIEAINVAIRRDAHTFEFTAQQNPTTETIRAYLRSKLVNYVMITQEQ